MNNGEAKPKRHLNQVQYIIVGFIIIIAFGTLLLMLPIASEDNTSSTFLDSMFTAVSSTCVTGLVTVDTSMHWSVFGQIVILCMIQIGGLGFMTIGVGLTIFLKRRISLRQRGLMQESVNALQIGGVVRLAKSIIKGTFIIEGVAALLLGIRFSFDFGFIKGMYYGIFHSVSAFCNAGFDLMGKSSGAFASLVDYRDDYFVTGIIMILIVVGGIGFIVWDDLRHKKLNFKKYLLHTKIVLVTTAVMLVGGCVVFWILENDGVLSGMNVAQKFNSSMFASVTARTAGFNTTDIGMYTDATKFFYMILMFIGGSPGSTAGGIKTVTVFVLAIYLISSLRGKASSEAFGRRISNETVKKASLVFLINMSVSLVAIIVIAANQQINIIDIMFEVFSAIGTVGLTSGITRELVTGSKIIIMFLMFCGRVGSLSFAMSFMEKQKTAKVMLPEENINVG